MGRPPREPFPYRGAPHLFTHLVIGLDLPQRIEQLDGLDVQFVVTAFDSKTRELESSIGVVACGA